jgi:integrase
MRSTMVNESRPPAGLSLRTVQQLHAILRVALQHAVREVVIPRNVAKLVQVPAGQRIEVRPLSVAETRMLLAAARSERLYALCVVLLAVGLQRGEALGLRWVDIDLDGRTLRVRRTLQRAAGKLHFVPPKTARSARTVPLPAVCVSALQEHRAKQETGRRKAGDSWQESGLVFTTAIGTAVEPRNVNRWFATLCERAGLRPVRLHDLRHTCATFLLTQGVPARVVMEILGHSAINVTMNIYAHVLPEVQRAAADRLDELLSTDADSAEQAEDH